MALSPPRILVAGPMISTLMDALERDFQVDTLWLAGDRDAFLREHGAAIRGLVTSFVYGADNALIEALPHLEIIASYGVGIERIAMETVRRRGIAVTNTPDISEPVADTAIALLLAVTRRICEADRFVRSGQWAQGDFPLGFQLGGKTCGIVGMGRIGRGVARRAEAFGMKIIYHGPHAKPDLPYPYYDNLEAMAREADCLILALPGGDQTKHLVDARILSALGPKGFLVNVARGSVLDEQTLIRALQSGHIAGAGLDVFEVEPLVESPLTALDNVVLLPHIGSATVETRHAMGDVVFKNLKAHFAGQPLQTPVA